MTTQTADAQRLVELVRAQFGLPDLVLQLARLLAAGQPVTVEEAAAAGGWTIDELRTELAHHPGVDWDDGHIAGFGLTPHRFTFDGHTVYAFCASDTFEFPVMLGRPGVIESVCAATGQPIRVEVSPDRVLLSIRQELLFRRSGLTTPWTTCGPRSAIWAASSAPPRLPATGWRTTPKER